MSKGDDVIPLVMPNKNSVIFLVELREKYCFFGCVKIKWSFLLLNPRKKDLFLDHINGGGSFLYLMEMTSFIWACTR